MNNQPRISIVIPTRNRVDSLNRTLLAVSNQTHSLTETIIVDASDIPLDSNLFDSKLTSLDIQVYHTHPSVCYQRNFGIEKSTSDYILLLDDDIELSEKYIEILVNSMETNKTETICSGLILENRNETWTYCEKEKSTLSLCMAYAFGLSVGFDIHKKALPKNIMSRAILNAYIRKGNFISKAGWPIITDFKEPVFKTPVYGLGAAMIRAEKLKSVRFDTAFYENGIGDNYDLAMSLNSNINVIMQAKAYHHREKTNRVDQKKSYYYRIAALHHILLKHKRFTFVNLLYFIWSLVGNSILFLGKGKIKMLFYNFEIIARVIFNFSLYKSKK